MNFWDAATDLPATRMAFLVVALFVAFGFEFINGFHDTANAVTTVIYTRTLGHAGRRLLRHHELPWGADRRR